MKLKKIASLMLAGIMAVSMLAACGEGKKDDSSSSSSEVTVAGAAAEINKALDKNARQISFTNDSTIENYLNDYYTKNKISYTDATGAATDAAAGKQASNAKIAQGVMSLISANWSDFHSDAGSDNILVMNARNDKKVVNSQVYILNAGKMTEAKALELVGEHIDDLVLPEEGTVGTKGENKNYSYSGTVAAIEAKTEGGTGSVWVIAVTITQTPSAK